MSSRTRTDITRAQQHQLTALLRHAWTHSAFYRELYTSHGIRATDLSDVTIRDLPTVTKSALMAQFDAAATDPRLRRRDVDEWLASRPDPRARFLDDFFVLRSSGSSGTYGVFPYDLPAWRTASTVAASRLPGLEPAADGRTRVAYYITGFENSATLTTSLHMAPGVHDVLNVSIFDPPEQVIQRLEAFQPHRLVAYSSALTRLAGWALDGRLRIAPRRLVANSDRLSPAMEETVRKAWPVPLHLLYVSSESIYIGTREPGRRDFTVLDDLNIVEVLDPEGREAGPGEPGRVVLTNLYNYALPIIRYDLRDHVRRGATHGIEPYSTLSDIQGRVDDTIPAVRDDGSPGALPWAPEEPLYYPGLRAIQFVAVGAGAIRIDYVADADNGEFLGQEFARVLARAGLARTPFTVRRVAALAYDPRTGKTEELRVETSHGAAPAPGVDTVVPARRQRLGPTNAFTPFARTALDGSVAARFEAQVALHGSRPAVVTDGRVLSYAALNGAANRLARVLLARGPGVGPVVLLMEHGAPTITAMLAALKTGKIFVPLDPSLPEARLRAMAEDAAPELFLADAPHRQLASALAGRARELVDADALDAGLTDDDLGLPVPSESVAYVLYTSGSTGEPRGVAQSHRNVLHNIMKYTNGAHLSPDDRMTMLLSFGFSAAMTNTFGALLNGAALYTLPVRERGLTGLPSLLRDAAITILKAVPTTFRVFCDSLPPTERFPAMRLVELVGEPVTPADLQRFAIHFPPPCLLHNRLGATEMHVIRQNFLDGTSNLSGGVVPVGYPVDDTEILILDDDGQPLPDSVPGEIAIKSPFLAVGYWRRPELTRAAFVPDPGGGDARIYRTGDVGLLRPDGCLEHHGRKDSQVKIRGQRIEIGEIEAALQAVPGVKAAAAVVREDRADDPRLVAYLVASSTPPPPTKVLRQALGVRLPAYMIPSAFMWLPALPLGATGKIDRRALPAPEASRSAESRFIAARNPFEARLARIWQDVLRLDAVGVDDDFFDLGGHSLLAMQILARVQDAFRVEIPLRLFFEAKTVAVQAAVILEQQLQDLPPEDRARLLGDLPAPDLPGERVQHHRQTDP
jgi:amino acid adenylation domain-containing protein